MSFFRPKAHLHLGRNESRLPDCSSLVPESRGKFGRRLGPQHHAVAVDGHVLPVSAADQLVKGQSRHLAGDVPQRDVHAGKGLERHSLLPVIAKEIVDPVPDRVAVKRVGTHDHRPYHVLDDALVRQCHRTWTEALAPAADAFVGLDFNEVCRAPGIVLLRIPEHVRHVAGQDVA